MFNDINDKERQILEEARSTTNCPVNTFYRPFTMGEIIMVKLNTSGDFLWLFKDEIKRGQPPFEVSNLQPISDTDVQSAIDEMRKRVSGDWWKLLLLDTAQHILDGK